MTNLTREQIEEQANIISMKLINVKQSLQKLTLLKGQLEEEMLALYGDKAKESRTVHILTDRYDIKVENGTTMKVDGDKLLNIIAKGDASIQDYAHRLFKYEPKVVKKEWDSADYNIQSVFFDCITTKASKPSIDIKAKETK